jgi:predicted dehydrogenase
MGLSHAISYSRNPGFEIIGLVNRSGRPLPEELRPYHVVGSFEEGMALKPDLVSINTYTDTHAKMAISAMEAGAHVFVEKPLAVSVDEAEQVVRTASKLKRKLVVGYILRHHPTWVEFVEQARELGPPYVMRMNLNQQSSGGAWAGHKRLLKSTTPIVDVGVHYLDVMLQIIDARPIQVRGVGVRLSTEIEETQVNYGHLQVLFDDGSVGWFESGWGPMISETAFFIKDVIGRRGSASIVTDEYAAGVDMDVHTLSARIRVHHAELASDGNFARRDTFREIGDEPDHQGLCDRQQQFVLEAIRDDVDLSKHMDDAVRSLAVVLAADRSMLSRQAVDL